MARILQSLVLFFLALFVLDCQLSEMDTRRAEVEAVVQAERAVILEKQHLEELRLKTDEAILFHKHNCTKEARDSANVLVRTDPVDAYAPYSLQMVAIGQSDAAWIVGFCD